MWKTLLSLLILFFVISCSNPGRMAEMAEKIERSEIADSTVVLDMDVCSVDELPLSMLIKDVKYVELETNDSSYLYAPTNIKITDSLIYVSDVREQLKRFDLEGNFIDDVYTRGQGPGEVVRLYDFDVDNDSLYLLDGAKSSILVYDHRRTLGSMRQLPFRATRFKHLSDGRFLFALAPYGLGNEEQSSLIALTDAHFTIQNTFFSQNVQVEGSTVRSPYFENSSSSIYFSPIYKRSIYRLDGKNLWMNYYLDFHTPYYETSKNVDGMVEAQEKGLYYTYTNPFHDDLYLWQSFFTSADKRGLLLIRLSDNKAVFIKNIRNDMDNVLDFDFESTRFYDVSRKQYVGTAIYYPESAFQKKEDIDAVKTMLVDSVEPLLLRKEREEINPVLVFYRLRDDIFQQLSMDKKR